MRLLPGIAGLMLLAAGGAMAADRVAMVGTIVSLVPPDGFVETAGTPGLTGPDGAVIRAFTMPGAYLFEDGMEDDDRLAPFFGIEGFVGAGAPEQRKADGKIVFVQEGKLADGTAVSVAVFNDSPNAAVTFAGLDGEAALAVLDSVKLTASEARGDGAVIRGLFLPLPAPFTNIAVSGINESGTLSLTDEKGRDRKAPHIDLFFPTADVSQGLDLAGLAAKFLELDTSKGGSAETTLLGVPAIRQQGHYFIGSRDGTGVGYVAQVGGQTVVLFARGPVDKMTDEVIAAVDAAAAGLQRYIPE